MILETSKIEKKLLTITQSQEMMTENINNFINQFSKEQAGVSNREILNKIDAQNEKIFALQVLT